MHDNDKYDEAKQIFDEVRKCEQQSWEEKYEKYGKGGGN